MRLRGGAVAMCVLCLLVQTQTPVGAKLIRASLYHHCVHTHMTTVYTHNVLMACVSGIQYINMSRKDSVSLSKSYHRILSLTNSRSWDGV